MQFVTMYFRPANIYCSVNTQQDVNGWRFGRGYLKGNNSLMFTLNLPDSLFKVTQNQVFDAKCKVLVHLLQN